jgi:hypothetical protein
LEIEKVKVKKNLKRKLNVYLASNAMKNEELDNESISNVSDNGSLSFIKSKYIKMQNNKDLSDIHSEPINNESKLNAKESKIKQKLKKKNRENDKDKKQQNTHNESDEIILLHKNKQEKIDIAILKEMKKKNKKIKNEFNDDSNFNITIEKPKRIKKESKCANNGKLFKMKKTKTEKKLAKSIGQNAIEQIINIVKNNIHFNDNFPVSNGDDCKFTPRSNYNSTKKHKRLSSSSEEDDKKFLKRSFQILDKSENKDKYASSNSLLTETSKSGTFFIQDIKQPNKKIYFDE